jgi:regulatory protein
VDARRVALGLLARREHSRAELSGKLGARDFDDDLVCTLLDELVDEGLLSDARFAEAYVHRRSEKGFGPVRIRHELHERGVEGDTIHTFLDDAAIAWDEIVGRERVKRFGGELPDDYRERARQARFLQQRGFTAEQIHAVFDAMEP